MRRAYGGLLLCLLGCDPTSGIASTADATLPNVKRYFDGRGSRVSEGPWSRIVVDLDPSTLYHLGGRRLDDEQPTFHLFGADARDGCEVTPNAGTWLMGKAQSAPTRLLPFAESFDEQGHGRVRFTNVDCEVQGLTLEDAGRPYARVFDHGYLVPTGKGYTFADPWRGEAREIAKNLQDTLLWGNSVLLWADDELKSYSEQFEPGSEWGNQVQSVVRIDDDFLVEDADGLHHVKLDPDTLALSSESVLSDACHLQRSGVVAPDTEKGSWVVAELPCGNPKPSLLHLAPDTFELVDSFELPFEADARLARALVDTTADPALKELGGGGANAGAGTTAQTLGAFYLTDADADADGRGTLWGWQQDLDAPVQLGEHADLDAAGILIPDSKWPGIAKVNYQRIGGYLAFDWIQFDWTGNTQLLAERVMRNSASGEWLVNFNGVAGDLPSLASQPYTVLAQSVPPAAGEAVSFIGDRRYARIDHFDGNSGRALLGTGSATPAEWDSVGSSVPPEYLRFAWFMPALVFIDAWNPQTSSGSLVVYNYELDARSTIAEGVSSFDLTSYPWDGMVYSIPRGQNQGIWFTKAK